MEAHIMRKVVSVTFPNIRFDSSAIDGLGTCIMIGSWRVEPIRSSGVFCSPGRVWELTGYHWRYRGWRWCDGPFVACSSDQVHSPWFDKFYDGLRREIYRWGGRRRAGACPLRHHGR